MSSVDEVVSVWLRTSSGSGRFLGTVPVADSCGGVGDSRGGVESSMLRDVQVGVGAGIFFNVGLPMLSSLKERQK